MDNLSVCAGKRVSGVPFANELDARADEWMHPLVVEELVHRRRAEGRFPQRVLAIAGEREARTGNRRLVFAVDGARARRADLELGLEVRRPVTAGRPVNGRRRIPVVPPREIRFVAIEQRQLAGHVPPGVGRERQVVGCCACARPATASAARHNRVVSVFIPSSCPVRCRTDGNRLRAWDWPGRWA